MSPSQKSHARTVSGCLFGLLVFVAGAVFALLLPRLLALAACW